MLPGDVNNDPLKALDNMIQRSRGGDAKGRERELKDGALRCIVALAGWELSGEEDAEGTALRILDDYRELENRRLLAICLLRLLAERAMRWVSEPPWRPKVVTLVESQLADDLYHDARIDRGMLGHEKVDLLGKSVRAQEGYLEEALQMLTSLDRLGAHRQSLMKALNSTLGKIILHPFLPGDIQGRLGELYARADAYLERRKDLGVVDTLNSAIEEIGQFVETLEESGTIYSQRLIHGVGEKLRALIEEDFAKNRAAQPTKVSIEARHKKYPLHLIGENFDLGVLVRNEGPGYAYDTRLEILADDSLKILSNVIEVGRLAPTQIQPVEIRSQLLESRHEVRTWMQVDWHDFDGSRRSNYFDFVLQGQRSDIEWEALAQSDPYSLEPVSTEEELVGRKDVMNRLIATAQGRSVGSSIVQGQKRVGKTSIAKAFKSHLERLGYMVVYLEGGQFGYPTAAATVRSLGSMLYREIVELEPRASRMQPPEFDEALAPLGEFLDEVMKLARDGRIIIVLDEFDQLPLELYDRGPIGNAFFLTLRSISALPKVGFLLVGGEKMAHIMDCQGYQLNKWSVVPVDYFTRESDWADYRELVQRPVSDTLEYTEDAFVALHEATGGNPYFTKLVCQQVFRMAVNRRDCHITRAEINKAVETTVKETDKNTFQHFWEDGIFDTGERATEKSVRRRKILIALCDALAEQCPASLGATAGNRLVRDIATVDTDLGEFVTRKVLVGGSERDTYDFKVPLFHKWLKSRGVHDVIATFADLDAVLSERQQEERTKVQPGEIVDLVKRWGVYKGQSITEDRVRAWLEQFIGPKEQRAMFAILKGLRFYSDGFVRQKMGEVHGIVKRGLIRGIEPGKVKRSDILVSYLDSPAKSGGRFASLYAEEASIYVENVIEKGKLAQALAEKEDVGVLVFVDDFVGTGRSACEYLRQLDVTISQIVAERGIKVFFIAVVAYVVGWKSVEEAAENLQMNVQSHCCELLDESARCFGARSVIFSDAKEREFAKSIALRHGKMLQKRQSLGYGDLEMAVVFERGCPNTSLPILWAESSSPRWVPLFKRL